MDRKILPRVLHTVRCMLQKRGYVVPEQREIPLNKHGLVVREKLSFIAQKQDDEDVSLRVHFIDDSKLMSRDIEAACDKTTKSGTKHVIIVAEIVVMSHINNQIRTQTSKNGMHLEIFSFAELMIDITEHELVPKHIVLSEEEKLAVLKRFCTTEAKMPKIKQNDPMAKFYNMQPGQMVQILRKSPTSGSSEYYRVVEQT